MPFRGVAIGKGGIGWKQGMSVTIPLPIPAPGSMMVTYIITTVAGGTLSIPGVSVAQNLDIEMARGEDRVFQLVYNPQGFAVDLSSAMLLLTMRDQNGNVKLTKASGAGISSQTALGTFLVSFAAADTSAFAAGIYPTDIWRTDVNNQLDLFVGQVVLRQTPRT